VDVTDDSEIKAVSAGGDVEQGAAGALLVMNLRRIRPGFSP
jgi:hypothetical protein